MDQTSGQQTERPARSGRGVWWLGGLALLVVGAAGYGWWYWQNNRTATPPPGNLTISERQEVFQAFWEMAKKEYPTFKEKQIDWDKVHTTYLKQVRQAPDDIAFDRVMLRAVGELKDTHTSLETPHFARANVNLRLTMDGDKVVVREVVSGSDAEQAGFKPGMEIVSVDGQPTAKVWKEISAEFSDSTAYRNRWIGARWLLGGMPDTSVQVVARGTDGKSITATLKRNTKGTPFTPYEYKQLDGGIAYLKIGTFNDGAVMIQALGAIEDVAKKQPSGLIIDLRGNGGGDAGFGMALTNYLSKTPVPYTYQWGASSGIVGPSMSKPAAQIYSGPVFVLTDPGCVSACDIFTTALQRDNLAKLVGEPPAGASYIANDRKLPHGFVIHLSGGSTEIGPDKQPIEGHPAQVAYPVAPTAADWAAGRDPVLAKALSLLKK